jgi:hypothetical protein
MSQSFTLRAGERGDETILSTGTTAAYVGGHPDAFVTRQPSFNFHDYQSGRPGFGRIRVFGDETFNHPGCNYNAPAPQLHHLRLRACGNVDAHQHAG